MPTTQELDRQIDNGVNRLARIRRSEQEWASDPTAVFPDSFPAVIAQNCQSEGRRQLRDLHHLSLERQRVATTPVPCQPPVSRTFFASSTSR